ncbi:hypothetical protein [Streptomyces sp. NBC_01304]|uniref:hypothetical protein n=1 Tax=Streptomyces sp. NBC_01304 TaxID=2903818 RepID=UPI002E1493E8|nr:hypothetical protein OG430_49055 [Streptomyces sp. NBC_01304]
MTKRTTEQQRARDLQDAEGIGYHEALNRVRADRAEPVSDEQTREANEPPAVAYVLQPTPEEAAANITAEELGVRALPADATPAQRAHAEAVWRAQTNPDLPCRCSGTKCSHGTRCTQEYLPETRGGDVEQCTGRFVHLDRHPGSMFDLTAWFDIYICADCEESYETTVTLPDIPWGEVRDRDQVDGERHTGVVGADTVTVIYDGIRHPNFPGADRDEDDDDYDDDPTGYYSGQCPECGAGGGGYEDCVCDADYGCEECGAGDRDHPYADCVCYGEDEGEAA